jgi:uncharacterized protein
MAKISAGLSLMLGNQFLQASLPLFESGKVDILEWSFDIGWARPKLPEWVDILLDEYSRSGNLVGHGVTFSALSGEWTPRAEWWLEKLRDELKNRNYRHISEHFGFMAAGNFHQGAPLPVPLTEDTMRLGKSRMRKLSEVANCPVGLENLALALSMKDVVDQGQFLHELLEEVDGFMILDLHNVYCQMMNFGCSLEDIIDTYPLSRVREMHVSGGSWMEALSARGTPIRRDTHDDDVPDEVFKMLESALPRCPQTEVVIFERLGSSLATPVDHEHMQADFLRLKTILENYE